MLAGLKFAMVLVLLVLVADVVPANQWKTDHFTLALPDEMRVDPGEDRLFADYPGDKTYNPPILILQSALGNQLDEFLLEFEEDFPDESMVKHTCQPECVLYSGQTNEVIEDELIHAIYSILQTPRMAIYISYMSPQEQSINQFFVDDLIQQLLNQSSHIID